MKFPDQEERYEYFRAISTGGAKGAALGLGVSTALSLFLLRTRPHLRTYSPSAKTFFFLAPPLFIGVTNMELSSKRFDQEKYGWGDMSEAAKKARAEREKLSAMSRVSVFARENKYFLIMSAWAGSLAGSFWWVNRDRYMTKAQKLVQARMYAQGLTVVLLLGSMLLTGVSSASEDRKKVMEKESHIWESVVAEEELRLRKQGYTDEQMHQAPIHHQSRAEHSPVVHSEAGQSSAA